jgi:hypothetical protein
VLPIGAESHLFPIPAIHANLVSVALDRLVILRLLRLYLKNGPGTEQANVKLHEEVDLPEEDWHRVTLSPSEGQAYRGELPHGGRDKQGASFLLG